MPSREIMGSNFNDKQDNPAAVTAAPARMIQYRIDPVLVAGSRLCDVSFIMNCLKGQSDNCADISYFGEDITTDDRCQRCSDKQGDKYQDRRELRIVVFEEYFADKTQKERVNQKDTETNCGELAYNNRGADLLFLQELQRMKSARQASGTGNILIEKYGCKISPVSWYWIKLPATHHTVARMTMPLKIYFILVFG